jgi:hypothetical protein
VATLSILVLATAAAATPPGGLEPDAGFLR